MEHSGETSAAQGEGRQTGRGVVLPMTLRFYEIFWSHYCEKARWCLDFKRLTYERVRVNPFMRREVTALGARGDVPVLQDGARLVEGSGAIADWIEKTHPDPPLLPGDP